MKKFIYTLASIGILLSGCANTNHLEPVAMNMYQHETNTGEYVAGGMVEVTSDMLK